MTAPLFELFGFLDHWKARATETELVWAKNSDYMREAL